MGVPIIGEPKLHAWFPTFIIGCPCDAKSVMTCVGVGATVQCPACKRTWGVPKANYDTTKNVMDVSIGQAVSKDLAV
jgi:hypothetical protein